MGRVQARKYRKKLREIGIKEGWFAGISSIYSTLRASRLVF